MAQITFVLIGAYLLGALPLASLVAQFAGKKDIWGLGDGNMGAKNTYLTVGVREGLLVGLFDMFKGALCIEMALYLQLPEWVVYAAGFLAILGHDFSLFVGFRGGQGMATMVGVFGMIVPQQTLRGFIIFAISLIFPRRWNLSCFLGFGSFTGLVWITGGPVWYPLFLLPTIGLKKIFQNALSRHAVV